MLSNSDSLISCCNTLMTLLFHSHSNSNSYYHLNTCIIKVLCSSAFWIIYLCYKRLIQRKAICFCNCCIIYLFRMTGIHQKGRVLLKTTSLQSYFSSCAGYISLHRKTRERKRKRSIFTFRSISRKKIKNKKISKVASSCYTKLSKLSFSD